MKTIELILLILYVLNILTLIILIFFERKNPEKVLKWAGVLLFLPIVGLLAYIYFGKGPTFSKRKSMLTKMENDKDYKEILFNQFKEAKDYNGISSIFSRELIQYNIVYNKSILTLNNEVELFNDIELLYSEMFKEIENATQYIHLLSFIIKPDYVGQRLVDILAKKASEGVAVYVVVDDLGTISASNKFFSSITKNGGTVCRFFNSKFNLFSSNYNYRNHRKILVVDGKVGFIGGANFGKEYLSCDKKITPWRDAHLKIQGTAVGLLDIRFMQDFNFTTGRNENVMLDNLEFKDEICPIQIVSSGPDSFDAGIESAYIKAIYQAQKSIFIQTPYLILDEPFKLALIAAKNSGVDVTIMIPGVPDKWIVYQSTLSYASELVKAGIKVYMFKGFLHSKTLCIDNEISSVGTFNLDIRSFKLHFEVTSFIYGEKFANKLLQSIKNDLDKNSIQMDLEFLKKRTVWQKFVERVAILFSPLF